MARDLLELGEGYEFPPQTRFFESDYHLPLHVIPKNFAQVACRSFEKLFAYDSRYGEKAIPGMYYVAANGVHLRTSVHQDGTLRNNKVNRTAIARFTGLDQDGSFYPAIEIKRISSVRRRIFSELVETKHVSLDFYSSQDTEPRASIKYDATNDQGTIVLPHGRYDNSSFINTLRIEDLERVAPGELLSLSFGVDALARTCLAEFDASREYNEDRPEAA